MAQLKQTTCCGLREYDGVMDFSTAKEVMLDAYRKFYAIGESRGWDSGAFIVFTCPTREKRLPKLVKYIEKNGLGTATLSPTKRNPNSGRNLHVMLFAVNHRGFHSWYNKHKPKFEIGDFVKNIAKDAERYGMEAEVSGVLGERVSVIYDNGETGVGGFDDYELLD